MDKQRRQKIKENIVKLHQVNKQIEQIKEQKRYYEEILDKLDSQSADLHSELYKDRPKEYIENVLAIAQEMAEKEGEEGSKATCDVLIFFVKEWLEYYDEYRDERLSYSEGKQLAMLKGEIE